MRGVTQGIKATIYLGMILWVGQLTNTQAASKTVDELGGNFDYCYCCHIRLGDRRYEGEVTKVLPGGRSLLGKSG